MQTRHVNLLVLPSELLIAIFSLAHSLQDLLNLGITCSKLRDIWKIYATQICNSVVSRCIPCPSHARRFLAIQRPYMQTHLGLPLSDFKEMIHNSRIIEKAIVQHEREIVPRVKCKRHDLQFPPGFFGNPPR